MFSLRLRLRLKESAPPIFRHKMKKAADYFCHTILFITSAITDYIRATMLTLRCLFTLSYDASLLCHDISGAYYSDIIIEITSP